MGLGIWANSQTSTSAALIPNRPKPREKRLPREVWIGTITQNSIKADDYKDMVRKIMIRLEEMASFEPDLISLMGPTGYKGKIVFKDQPKIVIWGALLSIILSNMFKRKVQ